MKYVKILFMPLSSGTRDRRELSVACDAGFECHAAAKEEPEGSGFSMDNVTVHHFSTRPLGEHFPNIINRLLSMVTWGFKVRKMRPDVVSGHDLPGMTSAWISTWFRPRKKRPLMVYDCHEFTPGTVARSKFNTMLIERYESFLMKKSWLSIVVNDAIADDMQKLYKLEQRPLVAKNTPFNWPVDSAVSSEIRRDMCVRLGLPESTFLALFHGMISPARRVETMLKAVSMLDNTAAVILGYGTDEYITFLKTQAEELGISDRVLFMPAVPNAELWKYVGAADVGVIPYGSIVNGKFVPGSVYSLPNKLFENIQALNPVVVSELPNMKRLVEQYDIGLIFDSEKPEELAAAIARIRDDDALRERFKKNLLKAKEEMCWENEKKELEATLRGAADTISARK